ncbi:MAG: hypothetical protein ABR509_03055 [Candidatus Limnocylindria bacterium]
MSQSSIASGVAAGVGHRDRREQGAYRVARAVRHSALVTDSHERRPESQASPTEPPGSLQQVGGTAADVRPDLAASPEDEAERVSDRGSRRRDSPSVTVADNAGHAPGAEQGTPDIGQEAGSVSEPG